MTTPASRPDASTEIFHTAKFISLRQKDGWFDYVHEDRCHGRIVAVLIFDRNFDTGHRILARWEHNPAHKPGLSLLSLTGGIEHPDPLHSAQMETEEEAGFDLDGDKYIRLGDVRPYKAADTIVTLYAADGAGKWPKPTDGDGSAGEKGAYCEWMPAKRVALCDDPLVAAMITRLRIFTGIDLLA